MKEILQGQSLAAALSAIRYACNEMIRRKDDPS